MPTHHKGRPAEVAALDAYIKLMRAADSLNTRLSATFEKYGLTFSQFGALEALYHLGPMCLGELARKILRSGGNLTLVANNLERNGWVRRIPSPEDRRVKRLELTPKGKSLIEKAFAEHAKNLTKQLNILTQSEQRELGRIAKKLGIQMAAD
jgi:MarR family transcriptional regulator, 2-MHQ and catechol-resistance regulon repressor